MAFCNKDAGCGHSCGRQDDHGGDCDCRETRCKASSAYVPPFKLDDSPSVMTLYAVKRADQFYHSTTSSGASVWVDGLVDGVRVWTRPATARKRLVEIKKHWPRAVLARVCVTGVVVECVK